LEPRKQFGYFRYDDFPTTRSSKAHAEGKLMATQDILWTGSEQHVLVPQQADPNWTVTANLLWTNRRVLLRVMLIAGVVSLAIAFAIPKRYVATASIMPPESGGSGLAMLAAIAGHSSGLGGLGSVAGGLLGSSHNSGALFVDLLHSGTISSRLIDRYQLQTAYHKRYRVDTAKYLAHHTTVVEDKKSGVITISVEDTDRRRARDLTQAYLDELNALVMRTNTSSAHQERVFIERRLKSVQEDLERAQLELSEFSSKHVTVDIKEQTRAMVEAAAKLQGQLIVGQSEVDSLKEIYGDGNVRVRAAQVRVTDLQRELLKMTGNAAPLTSDGDTVSEAADGSNELYPPLRQLPRLAVPYADIYRRVRVQETVFELLTQQYEMSRIQEAKDIPVVSVIDSPGIPEKKSFPPRLVVAIILTAMACCGTCALVIMRQRWHETRADDPRRVFIERVLQSLPKNMLLKSTSNRAVQS
jgi:capsule polysaccharide export protein KpsE/RkpR